MKDMQAHLEKLRTEAEECELISKLATNASKKELFAKMAAHHKALADEVERAMLDRKIEELVTYTKLTFPFRRNPSREGIYGKETSSSSRHSN
ncbi:hypothetical protein ACVI1L_006851 [Bradyrhizobium sp. USDA 4516]